MGGRRLQPAETHASRPPASTGGDPLVPVPETRGDTPQTIRNRANLLAVPPTQHQAAGGHLQLHLQYKI